MGINKYLVSKYFVRTFFQMIIMGMLTAFLLCGCGKTSKSIEDYASTEWTFSDYTPDQAVKDGCIVILSDGSLYSDGRPWEEFLADAQKGKNAYLRVVHYLEGSVYVDDLLYQDDRYWYVHVYDTNTERESGSFSDYRYLRRVSKVLQTGVEASYYVITDEKNITFEEVEGAFISSTFPYEGPDFQWLGFTVYLENPDSINQDAIEQSGSVGAYIDQLAVEIDSVPASAGISSHAYAYIPYLDAYGKIVSCGVMALQPLEQYLLQVRESGLREYLVAAAMVEICQMDDTQVLGNGSVKGWSSAGEFIELLQLLKNGLNQELNNIITDESLSAEKRIEKLGAYGVLAIPSIRTYLEAMKTGNEEGDSYYSELKNLCDAYDLSTEEEAFLKTWLEEL